MVQAFKWLSRAIGLLVAMVLSSFMVRSLVVSLRELMEFSMTTVDLKGKASNEPAAKHCYTDHCPHGRINKIIFKPLYPAGLSDREYVFDTLANMAGYLCATLHVPPPAILLTKQHNKNFPPIDPALPWDEFFNITYFEDDSPVLFTLWGNDANANINLTNIGLSKTCRGNSCFASAAADFQQVEAYWASMRYESLEYQQGFVWTIDCHFFPWMVNIMKFLQERDEERNVSPEQLERLLQQNQLPLHMEGCDFVRGRYSSTIKRIASQVWIKVKEETGEDNLFGTLHVRRTDAVKMCDTTLGAMQHYLKCSLNNTSSLAGSIVLLFSSDERDPVYRESVIQIPQGANSSGISHVRIVDIDRLVTATLMDLVASGAEKEWIKNNFFVFAVIQELQDQTWLHLTKRREFVCNNCDSVVEQIIAHEQNDSYWSFQCAENMYCALVARARIHV